MSGMSEGEKGRLSRMQGLLVEDGQLLEAGSTTMSTDFGSNFARSFGSGNI